MRFGLALFVASPWVFGGLALAQDDVADDILARTSAIYADPANWIDEEAYRARLAFLASDHFEGRAPGTRGDVLAQAYLASEFRAAGFVPGGVDGTWFQPVPLAGVRTTVKEPLSFAVNGETFAPTFLEDYVASIGGVADAARLADAQVVFVGYGIQAPEENWDDYKGLDVRGKVLLMMNNDPAGDPELFAGERRLYYGRWTYKYEIAAKLGAAGAIVIHTDASAGYPWQVVQGSFTREDFTLDGQSAPSMEMRGWMTFGAAERLCQLAGHELKTLWKQAQTRTFRPVALDARANLALTGEVRRIRSANVAALWPGQDPALRDEVVVVTSHFDHLGRNDRLQGDQIYNGAVDNATGSAGLIALAHAFHAAQAATRRSVLLLAVTGEESGLLGSLYYALHPTVPVEKLAGALNIDSLNRFGRTKDVSLIGFGKTDIDRHFVEEAAKQGRTVHGDPHPDRGYFYRSDQLSFARIGVPAIYMGRGSTFVDKDADYVTNVVDAWVNTVYHQPSDEYEESWDLSGAMEDLRLLTRVLVRVADADEVPAWTPGDEFEKLRKR